jgi:hypothetical protein
MRAVSPILTLALALAAAAPAAALEGTDVVRREFAFAGAGRTLSIDNVFGPVTVRAGGGERVVVVIRRTWSADDAAALERAKREVTLEVRESPERLELEQDGPFRREDGRRHGWDDPGYEVEWAWEVTVPAGVALEAATVNGGALVIEGVRGPVSASNVNGGVRLSGLGGRASASTVNGDLEADFEAVLAAPAKFSTVNGEIELAFPRGLGAELAFETLNGEVYTDFPFESAAVPAAVEREGGRSGARYRLGRDTVVRLGGGGPRLACSTVNGDIVIRER